MQREGGDGVRPLARVSWSRCPEFSTPRKSALRLGQLVRSLQAQQFAYDIASYPAPTRYLPVVPVVADLPRLSSLARAATRSGPKGGFAEIACINDPSLMNYQLKAGSFV